MAIRISMSGTIFPRLFPMTYRATFKARLPAPHSVTGDWMTALRPGADFPSGRLGLFSRTRPRETWKTRASISCLECLCTCTARNTPGAAQSTKRPSLRHQAAPFPFAGARPQRSVTPRGTSCGGLEPGRWTWRCDESFPSTKG